MRKITIGVSNITCSMCANAIEDYFKDLNIKAKVLVNAKKVVFYVEEEKYNFSFFIMHLKKIGYKPVLNNQETKKNKDFLKYFDIVLSTLIFLATVILMIIFGHSHENNWLRFTYLGFSTTFTIYFNKAHFKKYVYQIKTLNFGMDVLIITSTMIAYIYSLVITIFFGNKHMMDHFMVPVMIIYFSFIGHFIENIAKNKSNTILNELLKNIDENCLYVDENNNLVEKSIYDIKLKDKIFVKENSKVPLDGINLSNECYIDESNLTGESFPVKKNINDKVYMSTLNVRNNFYMEVTSLYEDSVYAKIISKIYETSLIKPRLQKIADKIAKIFVPLIFLISVITFFVLYLILKKDLSYSLQTMVAVLVVSCPCAFGIATPISLQIASQIAFKKNILYQDSKIFELARKIDCIAFDKTKTLTEGKITISNIYGNKDNLKYVYMLEKESNHPISEAFKDYENKDNQKVKDFKNLNGFGIFGKINNKEYIICSKEYITKNNFIYNKELNNIYNIYLEETKKGKIGIFLVIDKIVSNLITLEDKIKPDSHETIFYLKSLGIKTYLISGDSYETTKYVSNKLEIDDFYAQTLPEEKGEIIGKIKENNIVAYMGDGVNDSIAIKKADLGIACYKASDVASSIGSVSFLNSDLNSIIFLLELSKKTTINIYINFIWAFIYNFTMLPLAITGLIEPMYSAIGMVISSLMVVLNSLRMKLYKFDLNNVKTKIIYDKDIIKILNQNKIKYRSNKKYIKVRISDLYNLKIENIKVYNSINDI